MSRRIEGFFWDPITHRYYRELAQQAPTPNPIIVENNTPQLSKNSGSFFKLLKKRELGEKNIPLQSSFIQVRLESLNLNKNVICLNDYDPNDDICFLKGGRKSIFGLWNSSEGYQFIVEVTNTISPFDVGIIQSSRNCADYCDGYDNFKCFMSISNDFYRGIGIVRVLYNLPSNPPRSSLYQRFGRTRSHELNTTLYSCTCNVYRKYFAIGCENSVVIEGDDTFVESKPIEGNVHSVQFNDAGNTLFCGKNSGELSIWDLREPRYSINKRLFSVGIDETVLLTNQYHLLCGSFVGSLCKFDLRNLQKITEYNGHVHNVKKMPFSYYEGMDILCATGLDNGTRLWSSTGGLPFKCVFPPDKTRPHRSWIGNNGRFFLLQGIEKYYYNIF